MSHSHLQTQIDAARAYDALFVPALFGQWTADVADAAQLRGGDAALDVACGTGVLTAEVASRTGVEGRVVGLDPNPGMLAVAREHGSGIEWTEGSAEHLPFAAGSFDAVLCQFGLMFFRDRNQSVREMLRVLKPSGRLILVVWDAIENIPGYAAELKLVEHLGGPAAAEAIRAPFALGGKTDVLAMVREAGAVTADVTTLHGKARFPSIRVMMEAELRGWLPVMGVELGEEKIAAMPQAAESALAPFTTREGAVDFDVTVHMTVAQKR